jgi:hypothetical protein
MEKKTGDQTKFRANCSPNIHSAVVRDLETLVRHTFQPATAIMPYKIAPTGANSQLGGLHVGFAKGAYHVAISERAIIPAMNATA